MVEGKEELIYKYVICCHVNPSQFPVQERVGGGGGLLVINVEDNSALPAPASPSLVGIYMYYIPYIHLYVLILHYCKV